MVPNTRRITVSLFAILAIGVPAAAVAAPATWASAVASGSAASGRVTPPSEGLTIRAVGLKGDGCKGTGVPTISGDKQAFTVTYTDYVVEAGAGTKPADRRRGCTLTVETATPAGFAYMITKADYRGFAILADGASGVVRANYHVLGGPPTKFIEHAITPLDDPWQFTDSITASAWSSCGKKSKLVMNTELRISAGSSNADESSLIGMDSTDGEVRKNTYQLTWKRC